MPKRKEDPEVVVEVEIDEEEIELDENVIHEFGSEIQTAINIVVGNNVTKDIRIELVNVLMSIAAQVSIDVGISGEEFLGMADYFYEEGQKVVENEDRDISKLN